MSKKPAATSYTTLNRLMHAVSASVAGFSSERAFPADRTSAVKCRNGLAHVAVTVTIERHVRSLRFRLFVERALFCFFLLNTTVSVTTPHNTQARCNGVE